MEAVGKTYVENRKIVYSANTFFSTGGVWSFAQFSTGSVEK